MHSVKDDGWAVVVDDEEAKEEVGERERERGRDREATFILTNTASMQSVLEKGCTFFFFITRTPRVK